MNSILLSLNNLSVSVFDTVILKNINFSVSPGTIHAIMGPNGSGKSTLAYTIMGHPKYNIKYGSVVINNEDITDYLPDKRARCGLFLAFQQPQAIPGVRVSTFLREAYCAITGRVIAVDLFYQLLLDRMKQLHIDPSFADRNLNDGFSGGEKKRFEVLQLLVLQPKIAILDEIDSGLDIDALNIVARGIEIARKENPRMGIVIITHSQRILRHVVPDYVHVLCVGSIVQSGDATLADELENRGYDDYRRTKQNNTPS